MSEPYAWRWQGSPSIWLLPALVVAVWPRVDLALSELLHRTSGFTWAPDGALEIIRRFGPDLVVVSFIGCAVAWIASRKISGWRWPISTREIGYLGFTLLLGPGLAVETLLKPSWGRARPKDLVDFGGSASFTAPWQVTDQCATNCSFVSGHAAIAFWLTAYAFLLPVKWRTPGLAAGIALGYSMGAVRMLQGAHFLSDIIFAGAIVVAVNEILAHYFLRPRHE